MAAGPVDALVASGHLPYNDHERATAVPCNLWSSSVVASASTGNSWVEDVHSSDTVDKRVKEVVLIFHSGRQLHMKNLPREVTEEVSVFGKASLAISGFKKNAI